MVSHLKISKSMENFNRFEFETKAELHIVELPLLADPKHQEVILDFVLRQIRKKNPQCHFYTPEGKILSWLEITRLSLSPKIYVDHQHAQGENIGTTRYTFKGDRLLVAYFLPTGEQSHSVSYGLDVLESIPIAEQKAEVGVMLSKPQKQILRVELPQVKTEYLETGVPFEELARHNTPSSAWISIDRCVYDVTDYLPLHPGGKILARFAGTEASDQFERHHRWVNHRLLLQNCFLGHLRLI